MGKLLGAIMGLGLIGMGFILYVVASTGYVAHKLYEWYILGIVDGLPDLSVGQFMGISLFLTAIIPKNVNTIGKEYQDNQTAIVKILVGPWITLLIGFLMLFIVK